MPPIPQAVKKKAVGQSKRVSAEEDVPIDETSLMQVSLEAKRSGESLESKPKKKSKPTKAPTTSIQAFFSSKPEIGKLPVVICIEDEDCIERKACIEDEACVGEEDFVQVVPDEATVETNMVEIPVNSAFMLNDQVVNQLTVPTPDEHIKRKLFPEEDVPALVRIVSQACLGAHSKSWILEQIQPIPRFEKIPKSQVFQKLLLMGRYEKIGFDTKSRWWLTAPFLSMLPDTDKLAIQQLLKSVTKAAVVVHHLTRDDDSRIGKYKDRLQALLEEGKNLLCEKTKFELPKQELVLDDMDSLEVMKTLAEFVQGQQGVLSDIASQLHSRFPLYSQADFEAKIVLLAARKSYGVRQKNTIVNSDTNERALWRWEIVNLALAADSDSITTSRKKLALVAKYISATDKLISSLCKNADATRISKEEEIVQRHMREEELKRQKQIEKELKQEEKVLKEEEKNELKRQRDAGKEIEMKKAKPGKKIEQGIKLTSFFKKVATNEKPMTEMTSPCALNALRIDKKLETKEGDCLADLKNRSKRVKKQKDSEIVCLRVLLDDHLVTRSVKKKLFQFHENRRPPYFGTFRKKSSTISNRRPFAQDKTIDYSIDSDDEWQDEPDDGESIADSEIDNEEGAGDDGELDYQDGWLLQDNDCDQNSNNGSIAECTDRCAIGIIYLDDRQSLLDQFKIEFLSIEEEDVVLPLKLPSLDDIKLELLTKEELKQKSSDLFCTPTKKKLAEESSESATKRSLPFPEELMSELVKSIEANATLGINQMVSKFTDDMKKRFAFEYTGRGHGELRSVPAKTRTKQKINEIAIREKRSNDLKHRWYVHPYICSKFDIPIVPSILSFYPTNNN